MKHANSILETSEYFCQIPSKSIVTISSYTVSKLGRFFETQCIISEFGRHFRLFSVCYNRDVVEREK